MNAREQLLDAARERVTKDRSVVHGQPEQSLHRIAALWAAYRGESFTARDVALMLALLKIARLRANPAHEDSWVDLAGYAAIGAEVS